MTQEENAMKFDQLITFSIRSAPFGAVLVAIVIAILSLLPGSDLPSQNINDKLSHFIAYAGLSFLAVLARRKIPLVHMIVLAVGYGIALEVLQGVMPYGRSASWLDALANMGGVLFGAAAGMCLHRWSRRFGKV